VKMVKELEIIVCLKCGKHSAVEEGYKASQLSCPYCKDDVIYQSYKHRSLRFFAHPLEKVE
jgi:predicted RNA-binding Zn-ribbon protein involved in translation (DUF1610 family)